MALCYHLADSQVEPLIIFPDCQAMGRRSNRRNEANVGENRRCESAAENGEGNGSEEQQGSQQGPHNGDIVLKAYLHCEACAKKIVKCLMHFDGVEDVNTDCKNHTVTVKGTNVDPRNVAERIEKKCNKQVVILSPKLKEKNPTNKVEKTEANKKEPKVISVVLKLYIHCENCGENTKQSVQKMKGVKRVEVDLKNSQITVKGEFEPEKLVEFMDKKVGKRATIVKAEKQREEKKENNDQNNTNNNNNNNRTLNSQEPWYHPLEYEDYEYASQIFSDENAEACLIM